MTQLKVLILICISFAVLAGVRDIVSLMLLGTWGYRFIEFWWLYICFTLGFSFLSIKYLRLKIISAVLVLPVLSTILTRALFYLWLAAYFPISTDLVLHFFIGLYFSAILLLYLYTLGFYQKVFMPFMLVLLISLLPLAHQFAYEVKHEANLEKTSNQALKQGRTLFACAA